MSHTTGSNFEEKIESVLKIIESNSTNAIKDDTIVQKLQSSLQNYINTEKKSIKWCSYVGLVQFIEKILESCSNRINANSTPVSVALYFLSVIVKDEEAMSLQQTIDLFASSLPSIEDSPSCLLNALTVISSLLEHQSGVNWVIEQDLWSVLILPALVSRSIYVQKMAISVASKLLLKIFILKTFQDYIDALESVLASSDSNSDSDSELENGGKVNLSNHTGDEVDRSKYLKAVIDIYLNILNEVQKTPLHSNECLKLLYCRIYMVEDRFRKWFSTDVCSVFCKMRFLIGMVKFSEKVFGCPEDAELAALHLSFELDLLSGYAVQRKFVPEFIRQCSHLADHFNIVADHWSKSNDRENESLSSSQSILLAVTNWQIVGRRNFVIIAAQQPILLAKIEQIAYRNHWLHNNLATTLSYYIIEIIPLLFRFGIKSSTVFDKLAPSVFEEARLRQPRIFEVNDKIAELLETMLEANHVSPDEVSRAALSSLGGAAASFPNESIEVYILTLTEVLEKVLESASSGDWVGDGFFVGLVDVFVATAKRLGYTFRSKYMNSHLIKMFCSLARVTGMSLKVKLNCVRCVQSFLEIQHSPEHSSDTFENGFETILEVIETFLSDMEWEVRDSALELLRTLAEVHLNTRESRVVESFVDLFVEKNFMTMVFQALGDVEPYVQGSALKVLSSASASDKLWGAMELRGVERMSVRAFVRSEETAVKEASLCLLEALMVNKRLNWTTNEAVTNAIETVVHAGVRDQNDEIRIAAQRCLRQLFQMELLMNGFDFGEGSKTFSTTDIKERHWTKEEKRAVAKAVSRFCQIGHFNCLLESTNQASSDVFSVTLEFLEEIEALVEVLKTWDWLQSDPECSVSPRSTISNEPKRLKTDPNGANEPMDAANDLASRDEIIERVLDGSDLENISKLKKCPSECFDASKWWKENTGPILEVDEFPRRCDSMPLTSVTEELTNVRRKWKDFNDESSLVAANLASVLDDILLTIGPKQELTDAHERDCY